MRVASHRDRRRRNDCRVDSSDPSAPRSSSTSTDRSRRSSSAPDDARPLPGAIDVLARLAAGLGRVAIVSGRPVGFLARHLPVDGLAFVGLYGMEQSIDGEYVGRSARRAVSRRGRGRDRRARGAGCPAELVEPKSGISVTLHWRPDARAGRRRSSRSRTRSRARHGLAELRDPHGDRAAPADRRSTRAIAIDALVDGFDVGAFAGDDYGDLPAFAALARAVDDGRLRARGADRRARRPRRRPSSPARSTCSSTARPGCWRY